MVGSRNSVFSLGVIGCDSYKLEGYSFDKVLEVDMRVWLERRDLTSGSIPRIIILTTIPLWIGSLFYLGFWPWELHIAGRLGTEAIAALTIGGAGLHLFRLAVFSLGNATIAMIGHLIGQKDKRGVSQLAGEILIITFILTIVIAIGGYLVTPGLLSLLGAEEQVLNAAIPYLRLLLIGGVIASPVWIICALLRGAGEMVIPMLIVSGEIFLNSLLLLPLFFGLGFFPEMGLNWIALANVISGGIATATGLWILIKGKSAIKIGFKNRTNFSSYLPRLKTVREIANLAGLNTLEMFSMHVFGLVMVGLVALWGTSALAAYGIGQRLLMMVSLFGFDLATTSNILLANNLGAKEIKRAELSGWWACGFNVLIMTVGGMILLSLAEPIVSIFDKTPEVVRTSIDYLRITIPGWFFLAFWFVLRRAFIGAKDVRTPLFITLSGFGGVQISLAYFLPKITDLAINGIWWAIFVTAVFQGTISAILFRLGRWKPKTF